jgi:DNA-binding beta-propeller fold protein YncE
MTFDSASKLLYIPRTDRVSVVDSDTGQVVGEVPGFGDARSVALDGDGKFGYVTDIMDGTIGLVGVFDRATYKMVTTIKVGRIPGAILLDPITKTVFAFSTRDRNVTVIDASTNLVVATIPLPGRPHLAVTDNQGTIFVSLYPVGHATVQPDGRILRIDTRTQAIRATWSIDSCPQFSGLTLDAANRQLLGACPTQKLIAINAESGQVTPVGEVAIDSADLAFDPRHGLLFSATNSGILTIFHQESATQFTRQADVPTLLRASTVSVDPNRGRAFLVTASFGQRPVTGKGMEEMQARLIPIPDSFVVFVVGN